MEHNNHYLSDEELEALISDVESNTLLEAPPDFKKNILAKLPTAFPSRKKKISAKLELVTFSMKIVLSAAAAIAFLLIIPVQSHVISVSPVETGTDKSAELLETTNIISSQFCAYLYEKSNSIFQKEDIK